MRKSLRGHGSERHGRREVRVRELMRHNNVLPDWEGITGA